MPFDLNGNWWDDSGVSAFPPDEGGDVAAPSYLGGRDYSGYRPPPPEPSPPEFDWNAPVSAPQGTTESVSAPPRGDAAMQTIGETGYRPPTFEQFSPYLMTDPKRQASTLAENYLGPVSRQLQMWYPGITQDAIDAFGKVRVTAPNSYLGAYVSGEYTPPGKSPSWGDYVPRGESPGVSPAGDVALYEREAETALHEFAHAWSVPRFSEDDWSRFDSRVKQYLTRDDPTHWKLQNELIAGYASTNPEEAYSEIARVSGGNRANIPPDFREFYPWLRDQPTDLVSAPSAARFRVPEPTTQNEPFGPYRDYGRYKTALNAYRLTPQQLEYIRSADRRNALNYPGTEAERPFWQDLMIRNVQNALSRVSPEFVHAYGGRPRWLPR